MKLGIIGCGYMAREHVRASRVVDGVEFIAVTGRNMERTSAFASAHGIIKAFIKIEDMIESVQLDGIVVAVPELSTEDVCRNLRSYAGLLLLEKPVGHNLISAKRIADLLKKNSQCFVALNRRFYDSAIEAKSILESESATSDFRILEATDQQNYDAAMAAGQPKEVVENWMYANSIHTIDLMRSFCRGEVEKVTVLDPWKGAQTNYVSARIEFTSDDIAFYQCFWKSPAPWKININTSAVRLELRPLETLLRQDANSRNIKQILSENLDGDQKPGLVRQLEELAQHFRNGDSNSVSLNTSLESMSLISKIYEM